MDYQFSRFLVVVAALPVKCQFQFQDYDYTGLPAFVRYIIHECVMPSAAVITYPLRLLFLVPQRLERDNTQTISKSGPRQNARL